MDGFGNSVHHKNTVCVSIKKDELTKGSRENNILLFTVMDLEIVFRYHLSLTITTCSNSKRFLYL